MVIDPSISTFIWKMGALTRMYRKIYGVPNTFKQYRNLLKRVAATQ